MHRRVNDLLEAPQRGWGGEDDRAELAPVDWAAGRAKDARAEGRDDLRIHIFAGLLQLVRHLIGVDHIGTVLAQHRQNCALATADIARQADEIDSFWWHNCLKL